jgi:hypothetical protein
MHRLRNRPWYREPWPWFLMALPLAAVIASLYTLFLATRNADSVVTDHYYRRGLAVGGDIERERYAQALQLDGTIRDAGGRIDLRLNQAVSDPVLRLRLRHPLSQSKDVEILLSRTAPGVYDAVAPRLDAVRYRVHLETPEWRLAGVWKPGDAVTLFPGV